MSENSKIQWTDTAPGSDAQLILSALNIQTEADNLTIEDVLQP